ncbi:MULTISPECIES: helix-turn-helix domain-containing protein [unclassified Providencia]|uniref:helix-turn-helix domain-containing protein n=1 Tax=unclassified Providencia TaxID=2633465 RepID=UPI0023499AC1|nr:MULTISPECIES: helix-turn-helix transcriptional regulator [unclassified Providencia]
MKNNIISSRVGCFLRKARKDKNLSGKEIAKLINVSQQQVSRYETGITSLTLDQLDQYLFVLDKKWIELFKYIEFESIRNNTYIS